MRWLSVVKMSVTEYAARISSADKQVADKKTLVCSISQPKATPRQRRTSRCGAAAHERRTIAARSQGVESGHAMRHSTAQQASPAYDKVGAEHN